MTLSSISQNRIYSIVLEKMPFIMSVGERGRKEGEEESSQFPEGLGFREEEKRGLKKKVQESRQSLLSLSLSLFNRKCTVQRVRDWPFIFRKKGLK